MVISDVIMHVLEILIKVKDYIADWQLHQFGHFLFVYFGLCASFLIFTVYFSEETFELVDAFVHNDILLSHDLQQFT